MKSIRLILAASLLIIMTSNVKAQYLHESWAGLNFYAKENAEYRADKKPVKAVFIGNSITQMWKYARPDFWKDNDYVCRGISGQTTPQMLSRFRPDVVELHPQVVVIHGGINDIAWNTGAYDFEYTLGCIKSMAEIARANGIQVVIASMLPSTEFPWRKEITGVAAKVAQLNGAMKEYCQKEGFTYLDYFSALVLNDGSQSMSKELTTDGVHVTPAGYEIMEKTVIPVVEKLLKK